MSCPLYTDLTRGCIDRFEIILSIGDINLCESNEGYKDCIFYNTIQYPEKNCRFAEKCIGLHLDSKTAKMDIDIYALNNMSKNYCFTDNRSNCAIYKTFESGQSPSPLLFPDGTMIQMK
jgi:hypothetical protein